MNEIYYLRLHAARGIGVVTHRNIFSFILQHNLTLEQFFFDLSFWKLAGLNEEQQLALASSLPLAQKWQDELQKRNIQTIGYLEMTYPLRLKQVLQEKCPSILYIWGNESLWNNPNIGFCGSREASLRSIEVTQDMAKQVALQKWGVVSGHAKGIDRVAHHIALQNGGFTIVVVPEGLVGFKLNSELQSLVTQQNILIVSEFPPNAHWSMANAMTRNHTICGLSDALVVVQAGLKGGTFEAGKFALKQKMPLFVADYAYNEPNGLGNPILIQKGAIPIKRQKQTNEANLQYLFDKVIIHHQSLSKNNTIIPQQKSLLT